jgi:DUF4097 and DUF4098 domain-containing protein YvlB
MIKLIPAFITAGVMASGAMAEDVSVTEETFMFDVSTSTTVVIGTINGFIETEEWDGDQIDVSYEIVCSDSAEAGAIEVIHDTTDGIVFHVDYREGWNGPTDAVVDFRLRLPASTGFNASLRTVNGDVILKGGTGSSEISIVNGTADIDGYAGVLHVNVVNGDILFSDTPCISSANLVNGTIIGTLDTLECNADFSAVDGQVILILPADTHVSASTLSGEISIPGGEVTHEIVGSSAEYGEGENRVVVSTISGDIQISQ